MPSGGLAGPNQTKRSGPVPDCFQPPGAALLAGHGAVGLPKRLKQPRKLLQGLADTRLLHGANEPLVFDLHKRSKLAVGRELRGIGHQVDSH